MKIITTAILIGMILTHNCVDWLAEHLSDKTVFKPTQIEQDINQIKINGTSERTVNIQEEIKYTRLKESVVTWCKQHPEKIKYNSGLQF